MGNTFAIPGIYKILDYVYRNFASLPLNELMEYPITIAKEGFTLTQPTKDYFIHSLEPMFMWHENSKIVLSEVSKDLDSGIVKLEKLSDTYEHISTEGFNDFYVGDVSKSILQTVQIEGGHATSADFSKYELIENNKFNTKYNDLNLTGHSGPSIGGLMVLKYLDALTSNSENMMKLLQNVYIDRENNYEFFGNRKEYISNEIKKVTQSPSTIQVNTQMTPQPLSITFSSGYGQEFYV